MSFDVNALPINKKFSRRLVAPDTWLINPFDPGIATPRPYVLIGDEHALVIDPTNTRLPLREYIEACVTDKPLWVADTHSHGDHVDANYMFDDCEFYMSQICWDEIQARRALNDEEGRWINCERGTYTAHVLKPGDTIDLGNRVIEVLPYVGCHAPSSLIYFDHKTGTLFTGDELETGQMLVMGQPGTKSCVEQLRENVQNLLDGWGDKIQRVCPPHNGSPIHPLFLTHLVENCDRVLSGIDGDPDVRSMSFMIGPMWENSPMAKKWMEDPNILRSEWQGTSIVYNKTRLHKADIEGE